MALEPRYSGSPSSMPCSRPLSSSSSEACGIDTCKDFCFPLPAGFGLFREPYGGNISGYSSEDEPLLTFTSETALFLEIEGPGLSRIAGKKNVKGKQVRRLPLHP